MDSPQLITCNQMFGASNQQILKQIKEKNPFQNHKQASIGKIWTPRTLETYDSKQIGKIKENAQLKHIQTEQEHEYTVLENRLHEL